MTLLKVEVIEPMPCPFCEGTNINDEQGETYRWRIARCGECGACGPEVRTRVSGSGSSTQALFDARRDAFEEWNRRIAVTEFEQGKQP